MGPPLTSWHDAEDLQVALGRGRRHARRARGADGHGADGAAAGQRAREAAVVQRPEPRSGIVGDLGHWFGWLDG